MDDYALLAPEAEAGSWYPYSFMASDEANKHALKQSLKTIEETWSYILDSGISADNILLIGFSQGACLSLEFAAQNIQKPKAVIAFTGGLIGEKVQEDKYSGSFEHTTIFIGSSEKETLLSRMGANVKLMIFKDSNHTIRQEEIEWVNDNIL